jgi:hypothetical protein
VSYSLEYAPDAIDTLRKLDPWLQELALDAVEQAAEAAQLLRVRGRLNEAVVDFVHDHEGLRSYVFIVMRVDRTARHLKVMRFLAHVRSSGLSDDPQDAP